MAIDSRNDFVNSCLDLTTSTGSSTGAAVALASVAAQAASIRNVAKRVQATMSVSSGVIQPPLLVGLFDGGSSTGTLLASWHLSPSPASGLAPGPAMIDFDNLHIRGTAATAMALSTNANAGAGTLISLNLQSYAFPKSTSAVTFIS